MFKRTFKAFQYREFRVMWLGACTSSIGTWMQTLAQSWLVLQISGSPFLLGLDSFLGQAPIMMLSLVGGVIADRIDRRYILLASQLIQLCCAFTLAALVGFGKVQVWHILCLSFTVGIAQSFGGPAYQALIPTLVKAEDLPNAIALNSIQFNLARIIGPVLGGIALTKFGAAWCFLLNGVSYVAVIVTLLMVRSRFTPAASKETLLTSMRQGFRFILGREGMVALIVLAFLMTLLGIPVITFLPVFARDVFHQGPTTFTLLLSVSGAGSVVGALAVASLGHAKNKGRLTLAAITLLGMFVAAFALSRSLPLSCVILFFGSSALVSVFALISSLVQLITADEMRGRVMSVYNMAFRGGMPIGSLISGEMVERFGVPAVIAVNGMLLAATGLYFAVVQRKVTRV